MDTDKLIAAYQAAGQGQVFAFWDSLSPAERQTLAAQAAEIDLPEVAHLNETLVFKKGGAGVNLEGLQPAPVERLPEHGGPTSPKGFEGRVPTSPKGSERRGGDPKKWAAAKAVG